MKSMAGLFTPVAPSAARLETLLARRARGLAFRAGGTDWTFSSGGERGGVRGVVAYGGLGQSEFSLWLDEAGWRAAAAATLEVGPEDVAGLPPTLVLAALECFFRDALSKVEVGLGLPCSLSRVEVGGSPALASVFPFRLRRGDGLVLSGAWVAPEGQWREALEAALRRVTPPPAPLPGDLALEGVVSAGIWRLRAGDLNSLAKGDVVLAPPGASRHLTVGRRIRFAADFQKGKLVADGKSMSGAAGAGVAAPDPVDAPLAALDAAEVELRAEVGRLNVTLAELRRLSVGEVVEFATPVDSPATLVAGGRAVAVGDLVDVGGRVGVRVTALAQGREENA
ncbi:MAG: type III secretion system cytoplasmic ring protein SctQ [Planctomycetota bacterium]|jgi:type III secretion system YscQ/HrcQ family protein|nr:type III secretion system cytoplasmic ring protein SctQ [Planctomycetota bacterium]